LLLLLLWVYGADGVEKVSDDGAQCSGCLRMSPWPEGGSRTPPPGPVEFCYPSSPSIRRGRVGRVVSSSDP
jgi:hypothetical protein